MNRERAVGWIDAAADKPVQRLKVALDGACRCGLKPAKPGLCARQQPVAAMGDGDCSYFFDRVAEFAIRDARVSHVSDDAGTILPPRASAMQPEKPIVIHGASKGRVEQTN